MNLTVTRAGHAPVRVRLSELALGDVLRANIVGMGTALGRRTFLNDLLHQAKAVHFVRWRCAT